MNWLNTAAYNRTYDLEQELNTIRQAAGGMCNLSNPDGTYSLDLNLPQHLWANLVFENDIEMNRLPF